MGLTPARAAKAASERSRPGWDQAVRAMAAVMGPMPVLVRSPAAGVALSRVVMVVRLVASWVSRAVMWSVPEKMEAWFSCREFVDVSVS